MSHFYVFIVLGMLILTSSELTTAAEAPVKTPFLFISKLSPAGVPLPAELATLNVKVRLDFYTPNDTQKTSDKDYFANTKSAEEIGRYSWRDILLVNSKPGADNPNSSNKRIQIRAKVSGLKTLIEKNDPRFDLFPVRIYRTFMNEVDDDEAVYENAFTKLFGKAEKDSKGHVKEPVGREVLLHRLKEISGDDAIYISDPIDVSEDRELNPAKGTLPPPPSFAVFDADAYYTQWDKTIGDEEPDGWAFAQALKAQGFVSAGLAHPSPKKLHPHKGDVYQFALSLKDKEVLDITANVTAEDVSDPVAITKLKALPEQALRSPLNDKMKNIGASKIIGRPVASGQFLISTGVQKLIVSALAPATEGDVSWRFTGIFHAIDGHTDQCLIRAPAPIFFFSGHGWNKDFNGKHEPLINSYSGDNSAAVSEPNFAVYCTPYFVNPWNRTPSAKEGNFIELSDKWKKSELRLQWLFLLGCQALSQDDDPFKKWNSASGNFGNLIINELGAKGILSFADHGFTSASFMKRFVAQAAQKGIAQTWLDIWNDTEAQAYTWFETNEHYGQSPRKTYLKNLSKIIPAYAVRQENVSDKLTPEALNIPTGKPTVNVKASHNNTPVEISGEFCE